MTVTSDGTEELPYCSWRVECTWDDDMKAACADAICEASGYSSGTFISSDVDPCEESSTDELGWVYDVYADDTYDVSVEYPTAPSWDESAVTAECE